MLDAGPSALVVDTFDPDPLSEAGQALVLHRRTPWGSEATDGLARATVEGQPGTVEAGSTVIAYDDPDPEVRREQGRCRADEFGAFGDEPGPLSLADADLAAVYLTVTDEAGNESLPVPATNVEWVATLGGKVSGSQFENRTVFSTTPYLTASRQQVLGAEYEPQQDDVRLVERLDGEALVYAAEQRWLERSPVGGHPNVWGDHSLLYDCVRDRALLVGGTSTGGVWQWDFGTGAWTDLAAHGRRPGNRGAGVAAYDSARDRVVLFGGSGCEGQCGDLWEWDPETGQWTDLTPDVLPAIWPAARQAHATAYDSARGRILLFGGKMARWNDEANRMENTYLGDTWEWDGEARIWTQRAVEAGGPPPRADHRLAYDSGRGRVVLFGGKDDDRDWGDTWEWNGEAGTWGERAVAGPRPEPRSDHALAYDRRRGVVLLVGGRAGGELSDVWEWDGLQAAWTPRAPEPGPTSWVAARSGHAVTYAAASDRFLLTGGYDGDRWQRETWEWDASTETWTDRTPSSESPGPRYGHEMVYDSTRESVVLFGGYGRRDIWAWDGRRGAWTDLTLGERPTDRGSTAMAYDSGRRKVVLFGGGNDGPMWNDTWEWDSATARWRGVILWVPWPNAPGNSYAHALAYDVGNARTVLYGGNGPQVGTDTWEWDGGHWQRWQPAGQPPPARYDHAMAYDVDRGRVVLFGGTAGSHEVWEWDGGQKSWQQRTPAELPAAWPPGRRQHVMAYDAHRRRIVVIGGIGPLGDVWEWDPASGGWAEQTPDRVGPSPRTKAGLAYDADRRTLVLYGGFGDDYLGDTWERPDGSGDRPAALWTVPLSATGIGDATVLGIDVRVAAGGRGHSADAIPATVDGADLLVWDAHPGGWRVLASNHSPPEHPSQITASFVEPDEIRRVVLGARQEVTLAAAPTEPNGNTDRLGQVGVDYVELTVRYTR